jgi:1,4-alpha-glucan branching enzyme
MTTRVVPAATAHQGMGAIPHSTGVAFRVWAPHAEAVAVVGTFNTWNAESDPMASEGNGYWYVDARSARVGDEYRFHLVTPWGIFTRIDPYAREVTNSIGNGVIHANDFDWGDDDFHIAHWNTLVIYELHVGTFRDENPGDGRPGRLDHISKQFHHLKKLGINAIQVMPVAEFAGDISWGYNPAHIFAVESSYGGPRALKRFVKQAHEHGFAVILDVVYNHFGPSDLDLWRFDGWSENDGGGIYFYNDWKAETPWGRSRPDYGRGEVRQFIHDNAMMWLEDFHFDGLRYDATVYIRTVKGPGDKDLPEGWSLVRWINRDVETRFPGRITIAEDLQNNEWLTKPVGEGGAGFAAQWDATFVHPIRHAVITPSDDERSMIAVRDALCMRYNIDSFERVIYSESHDEVANGKARVPHEISPGDQMGWFAQKRSTLAASLVFTAPGIPMIFQGQEFLQGEWFRDTVPLDWDQNDEFRGIVRLYRDLIHLRLNRNGCTRGLCGHHIEVHHVNDADKVIAFKRWDAGGPGDEVVVVANFRNEALENYIIGFPAPGAWKLRFNSDWKGYSPDFGNFPSGEVDAVPTAYDGQPCSAAVQIAPYSTLIYSRELV